MCSCPAELGKHCIVPAARALGEDHENLLFCSVTPLPYLKRTEKTSPTLGAAAGTGKTLVARALAASASRAGCKVAFFMRKGADILSKWVGEAERQLRLLFEEAQRQQPAIIFFDEIDGLAPVRRHSHPLWNASIAKCGSHMPAPSHIALD